MYANPSQTIQIQYKMFANTKCVYANPSQTALYTVHCKSCVNTVHVYANSCQTIQLEQIKHGWAFATLLMMICKYSRGICWPARYMNDV